LGYEDFSTLWMKNSANDREIPDNKRRNTPLTNKVEYYTVIIDTYVHHVTRIGCLICEFEEYGIRMDLTIMFPN
jgi:hypothetical protein